VIVRVARSPWRLLAYALVAVPAVLLAIDILFSHRIYPRPETATGSYQVTAADGSVTNVTYLVYTDNGKAQRRRDLGWGVALLIGGAATLGWAFAGVVAPRRLLRADEQGLTLWLDRRRDPPVRVAWGELSEVRSRLRRDEAGEVPVLSLLFRDPDRVPRDPRGGVAEPPWLHLFAGEWDHRARDVAALIEGQVTGFKGWEAYG
jgi:hypothetical protein